MKKIYLLSVMLLGLNYAFGQYQPVSKKAITVSDYSTATLDKHQIMPVKNPFSAADVRLSYNLIPEILFYKFDESGSTVTNHASNPPAGTATATILGALTQGGIGNSPCGNGALSGSALSSTTNYVSTGWGTDIGTGSWTISFWSSNIPIPTSARYIFGEASTSFRCFTGGAAGTNNWILRGTGMADVLITNGAVSAPAMNTFVYDSVAGAIYAYLNGVPLDTVPQTILNISGTNFKVGGYSNSIGLEGLIDEFRVYRRALSAAEVLALFSLTNTTQTINTGAYFSYTSPSGLYTWTSSGTYNDTIPNAGGCDSIITINLTIFTNPAPEVLYYKFNESGTTVTNHASSPPAGTATGTIMGGIMTQGGTGISPCNNGALSGPALTSTSNYVNTGWATNLGSSSWTISYWTANIPVPPSTRYIFGESGASFRCFTGGVAGDGNWILRGTGMTDVLITGGAVNASVMNTFVYDNIAGAVYAYLNGNLINTVLQSALNITGTAFKVGGYSSSTCLDGLMDEFRVYNRALSAQEVQALFNLNNSIATLTTSACFSYTSPSGHYSWTSSGTYNDTIPNAGGCDSVITIQLTIDTVNVAVTQAGATLTAVQNGAAYKWLDCNNAFAPVAGAVNQSFSPSVNGLYAVEVQYGSCADTSACYPVVTVGISEATAEIPVYVQPNPNSGVFNVVGQQTADLIEIYDILGNLVLEIQPDASIVPVDLSKTGSSVYFIRIYLDGKYKVIRVMVH